MTRVQIGAWLAALVVVWLVGAGLSRPLITWPLVHSPYCSADCGLNPVEPPYPAAELSSLPRLVDCTQLPLEGGFSLPAGFSADLFHLADHRSEWVPGLTGEITVSSRGVTQGVDLRVTPGWDDIEGVYSAGWRTRVTRDNPALARLRASERGGLSCDGPTIVSFACRSSDSSCVITQAIGAREGARATP